MGGRAKTHTDPALRLVKRSAPKAVKLPKGVAAAGKTKTPLLGKSITPTIPLAKPEPKAPKKAKPKPKAHLIEVRDVVKSGDKAYYKGVSRGLKKPRTVVVGKKSDLTAAQIKKGAPHKYGLEDLANNWVTGAKDSVLSTPQNAVQLSKAASALATRVRGDKGPSARMLAPSDGVTRNGYTASGRKVITRALGKGGSARMVELTDKEKLARTSEGENAIKDIKRGVTRSVPVQLARAELEGLRAAKAGLAGRTEEAGVHARRAKSRAKQALEEAKEQPFQATVDFATFGTVGGKVLGGLTRTANIAKRAVKPVKRLDPAHPHKKGKQGKYIKDRKYYKDEGNARPAALKRDGEQRAVIDNANERNPEGKRKRAVKAFDDQKKVQQSKARTPGQIPDALYAPHGRPLKRAGQKARDYWTPRITGRATRTESKLGASHRVQRDLTNAQARTRNVGLAGEQASVKTILGAVKEHGYSGFRMHGKGLKGQNIVLAALHATDTILPEHIADGPVKVDEVLAQWGGLQRQRQGHLRRESEDLRNRAGNTADGAAHREQALANDQQIRDIQKAIEHVSRVRNSLGKKKPKLKHDGNVAHLAERIRQQGAQSDADFIEATGLANDAAVTGGMAGQTQTSAAAYTAPAKFHGLIEQTPGGKAEAKVSVVDDAVRDRAHETPSPEDAKSTQTITTGKEPPAPQRVAVTAPGDSVPRRRVAAKRNDGRKAPQPPPQPRADIAPPREKPAFTEQNVNPLDEEGLGKDHEAMVELRNYKDAAIRGDHDAANAHLKAAFDLAEDGDGSMAGPVIRDINQQLGHKLSRPGAVVEYGRMSPEGKKGWSIVTDPKVGDGPTASLTEHHKTARVGVTHTTADADAIDLGAAKRAHKKAVRDMDSLVDAHARLVQAVHKGPAHDRQLSASQRRIDAKAAEIAELAGPAEAKLPDEKPLGRNSAAQRAAILDDLKTTDGGPSAKYEYHTSSDVSGVVNDGLKMGDVSSAPIMEEGYGTVVHVFKKGAVDRRSQLHGPRDVPPKPIATFTHGQLGIHPDSLAHGHRAEDLGDGPQPPMEWTPAEKAALAAQDAKQAQAITDAYPKPMVTLGAPTTKPKRERLPDRNEKLTMKPGDTFWEDVPNKFQWKGVQKQDLPGLLDRRHGEIIDAAHNPNVTFSDTNAMMADLNEAIRSGPRIGAFDIPARDARMKALRNDVKAIRKAKARRDATYEPAGAIGSTNGAQRADAYAAQDAAAAAEGKPPPPKDPVEQTAHNINERHAAIEEPTTDTFTEQMDATVADILKEEPRTGPGDVHDAYQWTDHELVRRAERKHKIKIVGTPFSVDTYRLVTGVTSEHQPYFGRTVSVGTEAPRVTSNKMGRTSDILNQKNPMGQVSLEGILRTESSKPRVASRDAFQRHLVDHTAAREITLPDGTTRTVIQDPSMGPAVPLNAAEAKALMAKSDMALEMLPGPNRKLTHPDDTAPYEATYYVVDAGAAQYYNALIKQPGQIELAMRAISRNFVRSVLPMSLGWQVMNPFEHAMRMAFLMSRQGLNPAATQRAVNRVEEYIQQGIDAGTVHPSLLHQFQAQKATHSAAIKNDMRHATTGDLRGGIRHPVSQIGQWVRSSQNIPILGLAIKAPKGMIDGLLTLSAKVEHASSWQLRMQAHREFFDALGYTDKMMKDINTMEHLVQQLDKNPALLPVLHNKIAEICGDYIRQSPFQARLAGGPVPFLTWIRESMKFVAKTLPNRSPLRLELALLSSSLTEDERLKLGLNWLRGDSKALNAAGLPSQPNTIQSQYAADFGGGVRLSFVNASAIGQAVAMVYDPLGTDGGAVFPMISRGLIRYLHPQNPNQQDLPLTDPARVWQGGKSVVAANVPFAGAVIGAIDPPGPPAGFGSKDTERWDSKTGKMVPRKEPGTMPILGKETFLQSDHKAAPTPTTLQRVAGALHLPFQDAKPYGEDYPTAEELEKNNAAYNDRKQRNAAGISPTADLQAIRDGRKLSPTPLPQGLADLRDPIIQRDLNRPRSGRPDMTGRWYPGEKAAHEAHVKAEKAQGEQWDKLAKRWDHLPPLERGKRLERWKAKQPDPLDLEIVEYNKFGDRVLKDSKAQAKWDKANGVVLNKRVQPKKAGAATTTNWPAKMLPLGDTPLPGATEGIATTYDPLQGGINGSEGSGAYAPAFSRGWGAARLGSAGGGVRNAWGLTVVKVTNKANGKSVLVPIIDNGPGGGNMNGKPRIIDLLPNVSRALNNGTADNLDVTVTPVGRISHADAKKFGSGQLSGAAAQSTGKASAGPTGSPAQIVNSDVLKMARGVGIMRTRVQNDASNASHGPTVDGGTSDHQGPGNVAWAADMSNGSSPTPEMDKLAARLAKRYNIPWNGSGLVNHTEGGYRYQLIYRTGRGGNHYNHVHFGIRLADPGDAGSDYIAEGGGTSDTGGSYSTGGGAGGGGTTPTDSTEPLGADPGSSYDSIQSLLNSDSTDSQAFIDALHKRRKKKL